MGAIRPFMPASTAAYQPMAMQDPLSLVSRLGVQTQIRMDGKVQYNEPLVQSIVTCREMAIPPLKTLFMSTNSTPSMLEALYTASRLADAGVQGVEQLYPSLTRWNSHPDPTIQMHLARFYRKINEPKTFGPMLATAIQAAVNQYPMVSSPAYNVTEEVGETVLNQIATRTAQETVKQLMPYLQPFWKQPSQPQPKK